jgi:signal transduction protein with GAF and PtsI domain
VNRLDGFVQRSTDHIERFEAVSDVYKAVADDTVLGREIPGKRSRGTTVEDAVEAIAEGLGAKKRKAVAEDRAE